MQTHCGVNVLLVDDEPANLLALEVVLEPLSATLVRANSGEEAMRKLQDTDFAAILLDVRMPGMDGFETARLIRSRPRSRTTPIIFVTADAFELSAEEAYAMGAVDFLTKPLLPAVIKAKVAFFIELQRGKDELRAAERRALQERAFLAAVLEAIEDGVVACDAEGRLTLFNRATRIFHGLPPNIPPIQSGTEMHLYREDGSTLLAKSEVPLFRALAGEQVRDARMVIAPRAGAVRTVVASGRPLYDDDGRKLGAVVSMHDVTAVREAQQAREATVREQARRQEAEAAAAAINASKERLRISQERYRALFDSIDEGFCLIDMIFDADGRCADFRFVEINPAFAKQTGLVDPVGKRMKELVPDHEPHWFATYGEVARTGQPARFVNEAKAMGRWFDVYAARLGGDGSNTVAVLFNDITDRKRANDDLRTLAEELAESDRRKTEFLATLAHELRNPLAPLASGLQVMKLSASDPVVVERTRSMMERQVNHMVHLVDDLLDIARISTGKVELKKERVDLQTIIAGAVETSMPLVEAGRHELLVHLPDEVMLLEVDLTRMAQVVSNLLNNAAKYTPARGRIGLAAHREKNEVVIAICDTGIGIPPAAMPTVFEMFTQVGRNMERAQGGLGIGLSLVRRLIELHGGTVTAASEGVGRGSTFTVRLPLLPGEPLPDAAPVTPRQGADATVDSSLRVLVVDDNVDAADTLSALLEMSGHVIRVANDGYQAIDSAREFQPQVVFLDIGLPGMNGYEVARKLRAIPGMERGILVALTGWGTREDRQRSSDAGFDHHLTKPADLHAVETLLSSLARVA